MKHAGETIYTISTFSGQLSYSVRFPFNCVECIMVVIHFPSIAGCFAPGIRRRQLHRAVPNAAAATVSKA